jgi:hypothetical protein
MTKQMYEHSVDGDREEFADQAVKNKWIDHVVYDIRETGVLKEPAVMERLRALGNEPKPTTPEEFKARMVADIAKWTAVVDGGSFERI